MSDLSRGPSPLAILSNERVVLYLTLREENVSILSIAKESVDAPDREQRACLFSLQGRALYIFSNEKKVRYLLILYAMEKRESSQSKE